MANSLNMHTVPHAVPLGSFEPAELGGYKLVMDFSPCIFIVSYDGRGREVDGWITSRERELWESLAFHPDIPENELRKVPTISRVL